MSLMGVEVWRWKPLEECQWGWCPGEVVQGCVHVHEQQGGWVWSWDQVEPVVEVEVWWLH